MTISALSCIVNIHSFSFSFSLGTELLAVYSGQWWHDIRRLLRPGLRAPTMESRATCLEAKWSFKSEDIGSGLTWRGMGSTRSTWTWQAVHKWILLQLSTQILACNGDMWRELCGNPMITLSHGTADYVNKLKQQRWKSYQTVKNFWYT